MVQLILIHTDKKISWKLIIAIEQLMRFCTHIRFPFLPVDVHLFEFSFELIIALYVFLQ